MPLAVLKETSGGSEEGGQGDIVEGCTGRTYGIAIYVSLRIKITM